VIALVAGRRVSRGSGFIGVRPLGPDSLAWCKNLDGYDTIPGQNPPIHVSTDDGILFYLRWTDYQRSFDGALAQYDFGFWSSGVANAYRDTLVHAGFPNFQYWSAPGWLFNFVIRPRLFRVRFD
jgi:hypothetical protein